MFIAEKLNTGIHAEKFIAVSNNLKEACVKLEAGSKYGEYEKTITHMLHRYYPRFLEFEARWVDALLKEEWEIKDKFCRYNLMFLLMSD